MKQKYFAPLYSSLITINSFIDIHQFPTSLSQIFLCCINCPAKSMFFSKSFGYAVRGILYIAAVSDNQESIRIDELAEQLAVPRHFSSKIMKKIVKNGILNSSKGPHGGFSLNDRTLSTSLFDLFLITDDGTELNKCMLGLKQCNSGKPCPLHNKLIQHKKGFLDMLSITTIKDLLQKDQPSFIKSLCGL